MTFRVYGVPVPQGSTRGFVHQGRALITHDNRQVEPWRQDIAGRARVAGVPTLAGPVLVSVSFIVPRPKSRPKKHREPDVRPDLDKLLRSVLDALTGIAYRDDAQVVRFGQVDKRYPMNDEPPGALITVRAV